MSLEQNVRRLAQQLSARVESLDGEHILEDAEIHAGHVIAEELFRFLGDIK